LGFLLACILAGWLPVVRILIEANNSRTLSLGNQGMHSSLVVTNAARNFLTFNPFAMIRIPFNNPFDDATRRQYFWEYFFRSSLFGEFGFDQIRHLARMLLTVALSLLPLLVVGFVRSLWKAFRAALPVTLTFVFLLIASVAYRVLFA